MLKSEYLYNMSDEDIILLSNFKYVQALNFKIIKAKALLATLLEPSFIDRDTSRINKVVKAIKFNQSLLEEIGA